MAATISSLRFRLGLALGGAILLGGVCFWAGRLSVQPVISGPGIQSTNAVVSTVIKSPTIPEETVNPVAAQIPSGPPAPSPLSRWDEKQWQQLISRPGTPARNAELAALLEQLAAVDPDRAMKQAQAEGNLKLRESLVQASLRGWAQLSPTNAANWAFALPDDSAREMALASVFTGAVATDPVQAVDLGKMLIQQHPDQALSCGSQLIDALCETGNFDAAVQLAAGGDKQQRSFWVAGAYSKWAEFQPDQAAAAAAAITDPDLRNEALHGIVGGWAEADPVAMVQFATKLPTDTDRSSILSQALQYWVKHDPEAASQWINSHEAGPEMDEGAAAVATMESVKPEVAIGWADSIFNPTLRSETLVMVLRSWMTEDLPAARQYFNNTKHLLPQDRQLIADSLTALSHQPLGP